MRRRKKKKKRVGIVIIIFIVIIFLLGGGYLVNKFLNSYVVFKNLDIELNSSVKLYDLIKNKDELVIVSDNYEIDTSEIGKKELYVIVKKGNEKKKYYFDVNIVDSSAPVIKCEEVISTVIGKSIDLKDYVEVDDNSGENVEISVIGDYSFNKAGEYNLSYKAVDDSLNVSEKEFILKVIDLQSDPVNYLEFNKLDSGEYLTDKGYTLVITDNGIAYIDGHIIVNKTYSLPASYKPKNPYSGSVNGDSCLDCIEKDVMKAFNKMEADARSVGINIYISSGYRSYNRQKYLFDSYSSRDGLENALKYSAKAGHSEHQTGYCFDLNTIDSSFDNTDEGIWVNNNAHLYGFIIRYPKGKESETGYQYESWHLRYVGVDLAHKLYNNGNWITMEEYFGLTSDYGN